MPQPQLLTFIVGLPVYEAGKGIKMGTSTLQTPAYPQYFVSGVPAMVPIAPPSLVENLPSVTPSNGSLLTAGKSNAFAHLSQLIVGLLKWHYTAHKNVGILKFQYDPKMPHCHDR